MGKLVRDKIPNIIEESGKTPVTRVLEFDEYRDELLNKLIEELNEYEEAYLLGSDAHIEELADVLEVVLAIVELTGKDAVEKARIKKAEERGTFKEKIYLMDE